MTKKNKPTKLSQQIAQGAVIHDAYSELMPVVTDVMLGRELDKFEGAAVLGMVVTTFYAGEDLDQFVAILQEMAEFRQAWHAVKK